MTPETEEKRRQLHLFIERVLKPETAVKGVVAIGSLASGYSHSNSDIDAVIFLDPYDLFIAPAEALWVPDANTFHTIFEKSSVPNGIELDLARLDLAKWADPDFEWPEGNRAELSAGWIAYDPHGDIAALIAKRAAYDDEIRMQRLDEALVWLDQHLNWKDPEQAWTRLGPVIAHDRLSGAYAWLVQAIFAYNRQWQIWRDREMEALLRLPWLPDGFHEHIPTAANPPSLDKAGYLARRDSLRALFQALLAQLSSSGEYSHAPVDQAFIRSHQEPGRAWNMDDWNSLHRVRYLGRS